MKNLPLFLFSLILLLAFAGCEDFFISDVNKNNLPSLNPKLVVNCIISPDEKYVVASVTKSVPLFVKKPSGGIPNEVQNLVKNANVTISNGNTQVMLTYVDTLNAYAYNPEKGALKILPAVSYSLKVSAAGFEEVSSSTTVPLSVTPFAQLKSVDTVSEQGSTAKSKRYIFSFKDIENEENYYYSKLTCYTYFPYNTFSQAVELTNDQLLSDVEQNGKLLDVWFLSQFDVNYKPKALLRVYNMDIHLWKFLKSKKAFNNSDQENPFSEPVIVYSNITNGLGVFGSYRAVNFPVNMQNP